MLTNDKIKQNVADAIARFLGDESVTQDDLAAMVGVHMGSISYYIRRKGVPNIEIAYRLADVLGITIDELVKGRKEG